MPESFDGEMGDCKMELKLERESYMVLKALFNMTNFRILRVIWVLQSIQSNFAGEKTDVRNEKVQKRYNQI